MLLSAVSVASDFQLLLDNFLRGMSIAVSHLSQDEISLLCVAFFVHWLLLHLCPLSFCLLNLMHLLWVFYFWSGWYVVNNLERFAFPQSIAHVIHLFACLQDLVHLLNPVPRNSSGQFYKSCLFAPVADPGCNFAYVFWPSFESFLMGTSNCPPFFACDQGDVWCSILPYLDLFPNMNVSPFDFEYCIQLLLTYFISALTLLKSSCWD